MHQPIRYLSLVLLKLSSQIFYFILLVSLNALADTKTKGANPLTKEIEIIEYDLLELVTRLDMGMDAFEVGIDATKIRNQLLYFERQLGTPTGGDQQWNESEQMILDAKIQLEALQEKMKIEGDWGKVRLRIQDFRGGDPGAIKFRYNYGF